jgi:hypothetical protein
LMLEHLHPQPTRSERQYRYLFTAKHHGGDKTAAQWQPGLSQDDEFAVFEGADERQLSDADGNLYGALPDGEDSLRFLGIYGEQIAEFPCPPAGSPWHGYPIWALNEEGPSNRRTHFAILVRFSWGCRKNVKT